MIELKYEFTLVQIDYAKLNFVILVANALNQPVERTLEVIYKEFMQSSSFWMIYNGLWRLIH